MPSESQALPGGALSEKTKARSYLRALSCLLPWCLQPATDRPPKQLRRTAYLDGLRGFAAFIVYWGHHELTTHALTSIEYGFGFNGQFHFATFPGIRVLFSGGGFAVAVFYVISGYVLSVKPVSLIHAGKTKDLADNLASALFRRWARLYIPVFAMTFLFMTILHVFGIWTSSMDLESNYLLELWRWQAEVREFSFLFSGKRFFVYNSYMWTIPLEFRGSIVIYTVLLAVSRFRRNARLWICLGLFMYFTFLVNGWYCAMFISGMMLCDLDLLARNEEFPQFLTKLEPAKRLKPYLYVGVLLLSFYLGSVPELGELEKSPGWVWFAWIVPGTKEDVQNFAFTWAGLLLVFCCSRLRWLRAGLESRVGQYLGRISFAFYLVHGPILWTLGDRLYVATSLKRLEPISNWENLFTVTWAGPLGLELAFLVPQIILLPLTLWVAELVTTFIDEASVRLLHRAYGSLILQPDEREYE